MPPSHARCHDAWVLGALQGFSTIAAVISVGFVLAHVGVLGMEARNILADLAFFVASPALLLVVLSKAPVSAVLSWGLVVAAGGAMAILFVVVNIGVDILYGVVDPRIRNV